MTSRELDFGIDDAYFTAVGQIVVAFQYLEEHLGYVVFLLIGGDRRVAQCITSEMGFDKLVHLIRSLFKLRIEQYGERGVGLPQYLETAMCLANAARDERNRIVHSQWGFDENRELVIEKIEAKAKHGLRAIRRDADTPGDLLEIAKRIATANEAVLEFSARFSGAYHSVY